MIHISETFSWLYIEWRWIGFVIAMYLLHTMIPSQIYISFSFSCDSPELQLGWEISYIGYDLSSISRLVGFVIWNTINYDWYVKLMTVWSLNLVLCVLFYPSIDLIWLAWMKSTEISKSLISNLHSNIWFANLFPTPCVAWRIIVLLLLSFFLVSCGPIIILCFLTDWSSNQIIFNFWVSS